MAQHNKDTDLLINKSAPDMENFNRLVRRIGGTASLVGAIACLAYSIFSMNMTLTNKAMFQLFHLQFPLCLQMFQHLFTLFLLASANSLGYIHYAPLKKSVVKQWLPCNILFILMLMSGAYALKLLSVPMVTIFKNVATALVTVGDNAIFGQPVSAGIIGSVVLMILSSIVAGYYDLAFNFSGYVWMSMNCLITAGYVLYMRYAMKQTKLNEWEMAYYNNFLALPTLLPLLLFSGEIPAVFSLDITPGMALMGIWSGISGFLLSLTSFWAIKSTSPTTYSITGALNKIPLAILGFTVFKSPVNAYSASSVALGLLSGALFALAKSRLMEAQKKAQASTLPLHSNPTSVNDPGAPSPPAHQRSPQEED